MGTVLQRRDKGVVKLGSVGKNVIWGRDWGEFRLVSRFVGCVKRAFLKENPGSNGNEGFGSAKVAGSPGRRFGFAGAVVRRVRELGVLRVCFIRGQSSRAVCRLIGKLLIY